MVKTATNAVMRPDALPTEIAFDGHVDSYIEDRSGRSGARPLGVVRPTNTPQIERLVRWANKSGVPLIPVSSRSGPRRRGDTVSSTPALIVDLGGMSRVIHIDGRDAVAVIEPGVTFAELEAGLASHDLLTFRPLLPRASKSVMAAFLEREPITRPGHHWDSADPLAAMEMVFGTGDPFRTGGGALPGTLEENLARGNRQLMNSGPGQTDFGRTIQGAQGSLAIVSWASILCLRKPAATVPLLVTADTLPPVVNTAYKMLRKRLDGQLFIVNAAQLALMMGANRSSYASLLATLPPWSLYVELTAPSWFSDEAIAYHRSDLSDFAHEAGAKLCDRVANVSAEEIARRISKFDDTDYKTRAAGSYEDVFFVSQLSRTQGQIEAISRITDISKTPVYMQPMTHGVNAHVELTFMAETQLAARARARAAAEALLDAGAFFSRPYHLWADLAFANDRTVLPLLRKTKEIFDPAGVLQPESQALGMAPPFRNTPA